MKELASLLTNRLAGMKVVPSKSLFPLGKEDFIKFLPKKLCPVCGRKLYPNVQGTIYRCKSRAKDKFFIKANTLAKYL